LRQRGPHKAKGEEEEDEEEKEEGEQQQQQHQHNRWRKQQHMAAAAAAEDCSSSSKQQQQQQQQQKMALLLAALHSADFASRNLQKTLLKTHIPVVFSMCQKYRFSKSSTSAEMKDLFKFQVIV
jgi:hypothetical protein